MSEPHWGCKSAANPLAPLCSRGELTSYVKNCMALHLHPQADVPHEIRYNPPVSLVWPRLAPVLSQGRALHAHQRLRPC